MTNTKTCLGCGQEFHRQKRKGEERLETITRWRRRKYCSKQCSAASSTYRENMRAVAAERGYGAWMIGKNASDEARAKISASLTGHQRNAGKTPSIETRKKLSAALKGERSHLWRGGRTNANALARASSDYRQWRKAVFERDNYTCVECGDRGGRLHADHIKPFALFPELRFEVSNGRALCVPCHMETPTYLKSGRRLVEAMFPAVKIVEV